VAAALANDYKARLILLHVMSASASPLASTPPDPLLPAELQEGLGKFPWPETSCPDLRIYHRVTEGDASTEILRLASMEKCDLIVVGTQGRTGLKRVLAPGTRRRCVLAVRVPPGRECAPTPLRGEKE
jgi:nucleotide-binding universal stress UspA family protein